MTKINILLWLATAGMVVAATAIVLKKNNQQAGNQLLPVDLHVVKMNDGWGYDVLVDKKVFIHQDCIPAISSFKKFCTKEDALAIGGRVVEKLKKGDKPAISLQELRQLHIVY